MSNWSLSEIEEIVFEEFGGVDDHTVSYEGVQLLKESAASDGFRTALQHDAQNDFGKNMGKKGFRIENVPRTLEGSSSFSAFDMEPIGLGGLLSAIGEATLPVDPLHIVDHSINIPYRDSQLPVDAGLSFMANGKESGDDLSCYDWQAADSFDDIDQIFRNCDPTFGQWSNTDCLSWLSSSSDLCDPENAYNSGLPSSSSQWSTFDSKQAENVASFHSTDSGQLPPYNLKNSCSSYQSYELAPDTGQVPRVSLPVKQCKGQSASKFRGKDKISISTNLSTVFVPDDMQQIDDQKHLASIFTTPDPSPFQPLPKQNNLVDSKSSCYLPKCRPISQANGKHSVYQDHFVHSSSIRIDNAFPSPVHSTFITGSISKNEASSSDFLTKVHDLKLKEITRQPGIGSSELAMSVHDHCNNSQEIPSISSTDYENSIKASSFEQLHNVMDQLDIQTKLCIRDSLYRLAKSAEKRHNFPCASNGNSECTAGAYGKGKTAKSMEHINVETETNSIDRFMAHLLFHGPQNPIFSANGVMPFELRVIPEEIDGPILRNEGY